MEKVFGTHLFGKVFGTQLFGKVFRTQLFGRDFSDVLRRSSWWTSSVSQTCFKLPAEYVHEILNNKI